MTDRKLKSIPRLTLIFIITLVISGSILTYFSINNITNFKELTQKKISEEQEEIVGHVSEIFHEKLEDITRTFDDKDIEWTYDSTKADIASFALDKNGSFIIPFYADGSLKKPAYNPSISYLRLVSLAEKAEHQEHNMAKAKRYYKTSLPQALNDVDSANSLNSLARVTGNLKQIDEAHKIYSDIINNHFSVLNPAGVPYSYFAVVQLIKQNELNRDSIIYDDVLSFLTLMEAGKIPLTTSSSYYLNEINEWIQLATVINKEQKSYLSELLNEISMQIEFYKKYSEIIWGTLADGRIAEQLKIFDQYNAYPGIGQDIGELIVSSSSGDTVRGFILDLEVLWKKDGIDLTEAETEFEYAIDLISPGDTDSSIKDNLILSTELSPYFPSHLVAVGLTNENIVDEYVTRRSWIYGIALVLLLGGMLLGVSLILRDIRRESKMVSLRSDFVSNVTHELKTPLTSISMFAESIFLSGDLSVSDQKKYSNVIIKESGNLKRMINNILSFSMREDGKQSYQLKKTNLSEVLTSTIEEFSYWLEKHGFKLETSIQYDVFILADKEAIKQALSNLINNAIKYSSESKNLNVRLFAKDDAVFLEVEDNGIGIPQDQINRIFEKFYRVRSKNMESTSGTGIGLTVTRDIIKAHGGSIEVSSVLDQGSTFRIKLKSDYNG